MPTRTLYLNDDGLKVYEEFKKTVKAGDVSPLFIGFMRQHLGKLKSESAGFIEVTVKVGSLGLEREKRFMGRRVFATWQGFGKPGVSKGYEFYLTPKENYVVVTSDLPDLAQVHFGATDQLHQAIEMDDNPEGAQGFIDEAMKWAEGDFGEYPYNRELDVFPTLLDMDGKVPADVVKRFSEKLALDAEPVEYLDV